MKKFLTLRNCMVFCGAFLLVLAFALSFAVAGKIVGNGGITLTVNGVFYNPKEVIVDGRITAIPEEYRYFAAVPVIGYILGAVGALAAVAVFFVVKNEKVKKFAVLGCGGLALVGAIMSFITLEPATHVFAKAMGFTMDQAHETLKAMGGVEKASPLAIIMSVLGTLGALAIGASQFLPEKK